MVGQVYLGFPFGRKVWVEEEGMLKARSWGGVCILTLQAQPDTLVHSRRRCCEGLARSGVQESKAACDGGGKTPCHQGKGTTLGLWLSYAHAPSPTLSSAGQELRVCSKGGGQAVHKETRLTELEHPGLRRHCVWLRGGGCGP